MNKSRHIWGIACLVLGALATRYTGTEAWPFDLTCLVGNVSFTILPAIILLLVLIFPLGAPVWSSVEPPQSAQAMTTGDTRIAASEVDLETIGWIYLLALLGGYAFGPRIGVPRGIWTIGAGITMLRLRETRYPNGVQVSGFKTFLGVLSMIIGALQYGLLEYGFVSLQAFDWAILPIILGAYLLVTPWFDKRQLLGKAKKG